MGYCMHVECLNLLVLISLGTLVLLADLATL